MAELLYRLGRACARRAWIVVVAWVATLGLAGAAYLAFGGTPSTTLSIPGTPTAQVTELLERELPAASGGTGSVVFATEDGAAFDEEQRQAISAALAAAGTADGVVQAVDPFASEAQRAAQAAALQGGLDEAAAGRAQLDQGQAQLDEARAQTEGAIAQLGEQPQLTAALAQLDAQQAQLDEQRAQLEGGEAQLNDGTTLLDLAAELRQVSPNGAAAIATVVFDKPQQEITPDTKDAVIDAVEAGLPAGVTADFSNEIAGGDVALGGIAEIIGVLAAAIVLFVMLGSFVAAGLPLVNALLGVGVAAAASLALSSVVEMTSVTPMLGVMLGLAVGIDYTLFIVNRHRRQLKAGMPVDESIGLSTGTSGNAVVFAGSTVFIALLALNVTGIPFLGLMGTVAAFSILVAVLVAITMTPALLGLLGLRLLPKKDRHAHEHAPVAHEPARPMRTGRAVLSIVLGVGVLAVVAIPAFSMRLGLPTGAAEPTDSAQYRAYHTISQEFGEGANGPLLVVAELPDGLDESALTPAQAAIGTRLGEVDDVVAVAPVGANDDRTLLAFQVVPTGGPDSESTEALVHTLRATTADVDGQAATLAVAGVASANIDISEKLDDALPLYLAVVIGLSVIILIVVFRSLLVPVIATLGFVLSLFAALGGVTAVYQWGWASGVFGVHDPAPVLSFLPTLLVGILFGLAMDYQLFLTSGMREAYAHGADARRAVSEGVRAGRAVVAAAAIIMISVFGGFVFSHLAVVRPIGFALAFGVLVDAFVVRMLIVPAVMHLAGEKAWWLPRWLDRLLPDVDVEGAKLERRHHLEPTS